MPSSALITRPGPRRAPASVWYAQEKADDIWLEVAPAYVARPGWRILLDGRDVSYNPGFAARVRPGASGRAVYLTTNGR